MITPTRKRVRSQRIRAQKIRLSGKRKQFDFGGWLSGRETYLRVEEPISKRVDWLHGRSLYRLAKAIVRRWEGQ